MNNKLPSQQSEDEWNGWDMAERRSGLKAFWLVMGCAFVSLIAVGVLFWWRHFGSQ